MQTVIIPTCRQLLFLIPVISLVSASAYGHHRPDMRAYPNIAVSPPKARLESLLNTAVREGLPGVSLRVKGPGIDFQGVAGVADLMTDEPFTTTHVMYVASLGKTFTAAVALQLCDEGQLDLESPITTWLPVEAAEHIPSSGKITLRHLLSHKSGLIDYLNDDKIWLSDFVRNPYKQWTHGDEIPYLYDKPLLFEPGTDYHYSNSNYVLVGWILEQVTGQSLHTLIRKRILVPLGLKYTFNGHETFGSVKRVHGYIRRLGRIIDTSPWYCRYGLADSGMHSTADELALFMKSLLNTNGILSKTMRREMTHVSESSQMPFGYGMGIFVQRSPWGLGYWYTNNGVDPGYHADMMYIKDLDLTVVLFANASQGVADIIYERLITAVLQVALEEARL
jgi:D-alanyl-D-alanine carboxypeptidase